MSSTADKLIANLKEGDAIKSELISALKTLLAARERTIAELKEQMEQARREGAETCAAKLVDDREREGTGMNESTNHITAEAIRRLASERLASNAFDDAMLLDDIAEKLEENDATIAEQAEALEGYRKFATEWLDSTIYCADVPEEKRLYSVIRHFLPAHEIAALRECGVETNHE